MTNKEKLAILQKCLEYYKIANETKNLHYKVVTITIGNELKKFIEEFISQLNNKEYKIYIEIVKLYNKYNEYL